MSPKGLDFFRLTKPEAAKMEVPFLVEEVATTLKYLNGDKAQGSNGYIAAFWQSAWDVIKDDVMKVFKDFYETRKFVKSINITFLVMVPKRAKGGGGGCNRGD